MATSDKFITSENLGTFAAAVKERYMKKSVGLAAFGQALGYIPATEGANQTFQIQGDLEVQGSISFEGEVDMSRISASWVQAGDMRVDSALSVGDTLTCNNIKDGLGNSYLRVKDIPTLTEEEMNGIIAMLN